MSTRSGKRIHSSFHENTIPTETELAMKSERKTRSKRLKENCDEINVISFKSKKKHNYVSYPSEELEVEDITVASKMELQNGRVSRKNTLKEHNEIEPSNEDISEESDNKKIIRHTRRTKTFAKDMENVSVNTENLSNSPIEVVNKKIKKGKKKKAKVQNVNEDDIVEPKKKSKKKKGKKSNSIVVEEIDTVRNKLNKLEKSNMSIESFHSAAGSPEKICEIVENIDESPEKISNLKNSFDVQLIPKSSEKKSKRRSSIKNATFDGNISSTSLLSSSMTRKVNTTDCKISLTNETSTKKRKSTFDVVDSSSPNVSKEFNGTSENINEQTNTENVINTTYEKETSEQNSMQPEEEGNSLNSNNNLDKPEKAMSVDKLNTTFEKETSSIKTNSVLTTEMLTPDKNKKISTQSLDATFDKNTKLDSTYDKIENNSAKSSLISSDATNITFDKSDENSRISITSDDSRTENILNTTPVLIESSMDESQINEEIKNKSPVSAPKPITPLKREGTFTKDGPDVIIMSPKPKMPTERTPTKRMSLTSPGNTPFPFSKSSQKEKCALNVTHSIEKAATRSLLTDVAPRLTRVMFCSPVDNPALATQNRRKVIKSSMKGSNKSFVFDDNSSRMSPARPGGRKRSYTQTDADDAHVKRKRLADGLQQSVDRLSRPRTVSATAKLVEPSTPSKPATPKPKSEGKSRTKLPNFAALHQRRFDKMESLDECQERKAKRAKQLLVPNGSVTVLERSSPKVPTDQPKSTKKTDTPTKPKLPTLDTLKKGYTRFGFKMNMENNPFSIPSKTVETKEVKLKRQGTLPSLAGATAVRKEVAKQAVMREKSFTDRRDVNRKENRFIIKGVRTNKRFELQMKMRNIN